MSEVLIIGGGVIGLAIARELHKRGVCDITVVDQAACCTEASWAAGGLLTPQSEANEAGEFFRLCSASRDIYSEFADELLDETGVDVELDRKGTLYLAFNDHDAAEIDARYDWQSRMGLPVERLSAAEARRAEPFVSPEIRSALYFPGDWQVDNRKLCAALRRYAELHGIRVRENTRVISITGSETGAVASTENGLLSAQTVIIATGAWTSLIEIHGKTEAAMVRPVKGQMIAYQGAKRIFDHVIYSPRGYLVPRRDGRMLVGATSEHAGFDRALTSDAASMLTSVATELSPSLVGQSLTDHWAGFRPFSADGLPVMGRLGGVDGVFIASGHYRNGILLAPITGQMIAEEVLGSSVIPQSFSPDRFQLKGIATVQ
jgi:glycine oxidase